MIPLNSVGQCTRQADKTDRPTDRPDQTRTPVVFPNAVALRITGPEMLCRADG